MGVSGTGALESPFQFRGAIAVASDFPTLAEVEAGWMFRVTATVTDNDATKTNTGDSFIADDEIVWNAVGGWTLLGNVALAESGVSFTPFKSNKEVTVGDGVVFFTIPSSMNGMILVDATASVYEVGTTGTTDAQVRRSRAGVDVDMLSTPVTIDSGAFTASDGVVDGANDDIETGDMIFPDVDATSTVKAKGLGVVLTFRLP